MPSQNAIVMRATPDELLLAQKLVNDLDKARPEVVVDIAVLEVSKNWERNLGIVLAAAASPCTLQWNPTTTRLPTLTTGTTGHGTHEHADQHQQQSDPQQSRAPELE